MMGRGLTSARDPARRPGARPKSNSAVTSNVQASPEPLSQRFTVRRIERGDVARSRAGTPEERRPVVVERGEVSRNLERVRFHLREPGRSEQRFQRPWPTEREALAFIE